MLHVSVDIRLKSLLRFFFGNCVGLLVIYGLYCCEIWAYQSRVLYRLFGMVGSKVEQGPWLQLAYLLFAALLVFFATSWGRGSMPGKGTVEFFGALILAGLLLWLAQPLLSSLTQRIFADVSLMRGQEIGFQLDFGFFLRRNLALFAVVRVAAYFFWFFAVKPAKKKKMQ